MGVELSFQNYVEDLFSSFEQFRIRTMFGGAGVYSGQDMFALISEDTLYLKADDSLKAELENAGAHAFQWTNPETGKTIQMSYVSLPESSLDDPDEAREWARKALAVARRSRQAKVKSPRRHPF